ncbi:MAG: hypothetical protein FWB75_09150 [Oscillospiraceae bacterium]|nr:hypothetical protein [Oscillospiraceae bacterium]
MAITKDAWFPYPHLPLKAGYTAHSTQSRYEVTASGFRPGKISYETFYPTHRNTGSHLIRTKSAEGQNPSKPRTRTGLHENRVGFSMPLEIALRTQALQDTALPPSTHPKLGVQSKHHGFQRYAL